MVDKKIIKDQIIESEPRWFGANNLISDHDCLGSISLDGVHKPNMEDDDCKFDEWNACVSKIFNGDIKTFEELYKAQIEFHEAAAHAYDLKIRLYESEMHRIEELNQYIEEITDRIMGVLFNE